MHQKQSISRSSASPKGSYTFYHVLSLVIAILLPTSGMVGIQDVGFAILSVICIYFFSKAVFPSTRQPTENIIDARSKAFICYITLGAVIGLFLPIIYMLIGVFEGSKEVIKDAAPHLFLLTCQVLMEGVTFNRNYSLPIRAFVPILFNSKRIFTLVEWLKKEVVKVNVDHGRFTGWVIFGLVLAAANMAFWCFNLFCFLLPIYLPRVFKYYSACH